MNVREWALPVYTILIQLAAGGLTAVWLLRWRFADRSGQELDRLTRVPILILSFTIGTAIVGAHFHLSRPFLSFLAMANLTQSWLSREIIATVLFFIATGGLALLLWLVEGRRRLKTALGWLAALFGLATVFSMGCVYLLPTQVAWNSPSIILSYFAEAALLGSVAIGAILLMDLNFDYERGVQDLEAKEIMVSRALKGLTTISVIALLTSLVLNAEQVLFLTAHQEAAAQASLRLLTEVYQSLYLIRMALSIAGTSWLAIGYFRLSRRAAASIKPLILPAYTACILVLVGEVLGRFLFYAIHVRIGI